MFTIKHIDPNGNEFAIEAESYFVEWDRGQDLVRVTTYDQKFRGQGDDYTGLWAGIPARSSNCSLGAQPHRIFVMNRDGATISTVAFVDFPVGETAPVPEEKLAA